MGCLNADKHVFDHKFGNIHFSGPCNRRCYFCIGQHMMDLDPLDNLETRLVGTFALERFLHMCQENGVKEINLTGSNTDPLLYKYLEELVTHIKGWNGGIFKVGIRTNGVAWAVVTADTKLLVDKWSFSITSVYKSTYQNTMGCGSPPDLMLIMKELGEHADVKINMVLTPETANLNEIYLMAVYATMCGIKRINLREPYGQPHIGDPLAEENVHFERQSDRYGMPVYMARHFGAVEIMYWDVHYVEVDSINLYANGRISTDYAISKGHSPYGEVKDQSHFPTAGRICDQWQKVEAK